MRVFNISENITVLRGTKAAEPPYRKRVSVELIAKFGKGPFSTEQMRDVLLFCQSFYINAFTERCQQETSFTFYKEVFMLNEMATDLRRSTHYHNLPDGLDKNYVSSYRRILKMLLEQACDVDMISGEKRDAAFISRITPVLNDLLYLGEMILDFSMSVAEQGMIEDVSDIRFDSNNLYKQSRRHHYEPIIEHISRETESFADKYIIDENGMTAFEQAVQQAFGFSNKAIPEVMAHLYYHFEMEPPRGIFADKTGFIKDAAKHTGVEESVMKTFLDGLTLHRANKMSLQELVIRPHSTDRFLYRPLLLWMINGKPFYMCGIYSYDEAENSLVLNAIPWGKAPVEWKLRPGFTAYINRKKDEHDRWLDDEVEKIVREKGLLFDRGVKKFHTCARSYPITGKGFGEIDFLILSPGIKKLFVTECKHLQGRYDMINWKNDHSHFTVDGKDLSYNSRLKAKVEWIIQHKKIVEEHLQLKHNDPSINLDDYTIEGVFVVNTPTFYMYNSVFRIYTYHRFGDVITGEHIDPTFSLMDDREDSTVLYKVCFPYFQKPKLLYYQMEDDEGVEYDKYGYPIKK